MNQRAVGILLMGLGGVAVVVAVVGMAVPGNGRGSVEATDTTSSSGETDISASSQVGTTLAMTTASVATTSTTSTSVATTTSLVATDMVAAFIDDFSTALRTGDEEFVFTRLHPEIVAAFGADLCRTWIQTEIMALSDYALDGAIAGPTTGILNTSNGQLALPDRYTAPVTFGFGGQDFAATADYVLLDDVVYFTGTCE